MSVRFSWLLAISLLLLGGISAQVPNVELPPPPVPDYVRPDLSAQAWDLSMIELPDAARQQLVATLVAVCRDYPGHKAVSSSWKARLLGIALRLAPADFDGVVANGQLARGVLPQPLHAHPVKLEQQAVTIMQIANLLLDDPSGRLNFELGYHLIQVAAQLDISNRAVLESFNQNAPALLWEVICPKSRAQNSVQDEETPDLKGTAAVVSAILFADAHGNVRPALKQLQATASKRPNSSGKPLELGLPKQTDKRTEASLPALRDLLRARTPQWPGGWRIDFQDLAVPATEQSGVSLAMGMLLESMVTGAELDPQAVLACGLQLESGLTVRTLNLEQLLNVRTTLPADALVVVAPVDLTEYADFLLSYPERWQELTQWHVCVAHNFNEAAALCVKERPPTLQRSLTDAAALIRQARTGGVVGLRSETMGRALTELLKIYPNDVTIQALEMIALKHLPSQLSVGGAMNLLGKIATPVNRAGSREFPIKTAWQDRLSATPFNKAKGQMERLRPTLPVEARAYADALIDLARMYDVFVLYPPLAASVRQEAERKMGVARDHVQQEFKDLRAKIPHTQVITAEAPRDPNPKATEEAADGAVVPEP